jgi:hypothetical protein
MRRTAAEQRELAQLIASQANDIQPARLGGSDRHYTVQLQSKDESKIALPEPAPTVMNLDQVLSAAAAFNEDEIRYLKANHIDNISISDLHVALSWSTARVDRVRKSIAQKLMAPAPPTIEVQYGRGDSLHLAYADLHAGLPVWAFAGVVTSDAFLEELSRARGKSIVVKQFPRMKKSTHSIRHRIMTNKLSDLQVKLRAEKTSLDKRIAESYAADDEHDRAEEVVNRLKAKSRPHGAAIDALTRAAEKKTACEVEIERQRDVVIAVETEIAGRKHEAAVAELATELAEYLKVERAQMRRAVKLNEIARKHGMHGTALARELAPPTVPTDPTSGFMQRSFTIAIFNDMLRMAQCHGSQAAAA